MRAVAARGDIDHVRRRGDRGENDHGFRPGAAADEPHDARRHNVQPDEHHREHPDETHERRRSRVRAETAGQRQAEVIRKSDPREQHADCRRRKEAQAQARHLRGIMLRRALRRHFKRYVLRLRVGLGEIVRPADRRRGEKPHEACPKAPARGPARGGIRCQGSFFLLLFSPARLALRLLPRLPARPALQGRGIKVRVVLKALVVYFALGGLFRLRCVLIVPPVRFPGLLRLVRRGVRLGLILRLAGIKFFVFGVFRFFVRIFGLILRLCRVIRLLGGIALRLRPVFRFRRFRRGGLLRRLVPALLENAPSEKPGAPKLRERRLYRVFAIAPSVSGISALADDLIHKDRAAAEALSDVILPSRGMPTVKSHCSETRRPMPKPSDPMTSAAGRSFSSATDRRERPPPCRRPKGPFSSAHRAPRDVRHARDEHMLRRARARLVHHGGELRRRAAWG